VFLEKAVEEEEEMEEGVFTIKECVVYLEIIILVVFLQQSVSDVLYHTRFIMKEDI
jgi:hypothetical protein